MAVEKKVSVVTLGCPKNVVDTEVLLAQLRSNNIRLVNENAGADTVLINTCGFIQDAKRESLEAIFHAVEKKKRGEVRNIVVFGCLSERFRNELSAELPEVDRFIGTNRLREVLESIGADYRKELLGERLLTTPSHIAYLKISEGCDHPCSFCAIPLMRGPHRSVPLEHLLAEAGNLAAKGVRELIVIGQDTTFYGADLYGQQRLAPLLSELAAIEGIEWIRLMYAYPAHFPLDVIDVFRTNPKLCRYIDMPVQHVSDAVLKSMRRGITERATRELIGRLRTDLPDLALRTTLIVGYPNETEDDFRRLCEFVEETQFHRLGVFPYSREEGTAAYDLGDPVPHEVKMERQSIILDIQKEISDRYNASLVGNVVRILVDSSGSGKAVGRTQWDAPEIDQDVVVHAERPPAAGTFLRVTIDSAEEYTLQASAGITTG